MLPQDSIMGLKVTMMMLIFAITKVSGFGELGHHIIGQHVQKYLSNSSLSRIKKCKYLDDFSNDLGQASNWADKLRAKSGFQWTGQYHYLDIPDDPPQSCTFAYPKANINLITGINTFSKTLQTSECDRFGFLMLLHLSQDLHQPLHLTGKEKGGNQQKVYLDHQHMNLHHAWDTYFIEKLGQHMIDQYIAAHMQENTHVSGDFVDWIKEVSRLNCDIVWHFNSVNYKRRAEDVILPLIVMAVRHTLNLLEGCS